MQPSGIGGRGRRNGGERRPAVIPSAARNLHVIQSALRSPFPVPRAPSPVDSFTLMPNPDSSSSVRIDKWLWAARFFKTRSLATEGVNGGKVELNGLRPKPSKEVKVGDQLRVRLGPFIHAITIRALSERRGPAAAAALLFEESPESVAERERLREQHRLAPSIHREEGGRPTKKERRAMSAFEERQRRRSR